MHCVAQLPITFQTS